MSKSLYETLGVSESASADAKRSMLRMKYFQILRKNNSMISLVIKCSVVRTSMTLHVVKVKV
jgi:hypothetical protein